MTAAIAVAAVVGIPVLIEKAAPYEITVSECLVCGRIQSVERKWMQAPRKSIETPDSTVWLEKQTNPEHDHWWVGCSTEVRPRWFASSMIGCGGVGAISSLHYLSKKRGHESVEPYVSRYMELVTERDLASIQEFVWNDLQAALTP